jgi:hypothetical protein
LLGCNHHELPVYLRAYVSYLASSLILKLLLLLLPYLYSISLLLLLPLVETVGGENLQKPLLTAPLPLLGLSDFCDGRTDNEGKTGRKGCYGKKNVFPWLTWFGFRPRFIAYEDSISLHRNLEFTFSGLLYCLFYSYLNFSYSCKIFIYLFIYLYIYKIFRVRKRTARFRCVSVVQTVMGFQRIG